MAADDNEVWGPGEMTRALKRIETKVDEGNGKAVTKDLYERDRKAIAEHFERVEETATKDRADVEKRFAAIADGKRFSTGNLIAIGIAAFTGALTLFVTYFHGGA
jgi:hypothetical protein